MWLPILLLTCAGLAGAALLILYVVAVSALEDAARRYPEGRDDVGR